MVHDLYCGLCRVITRRQWLQQLPDNAERPRTRMVSVSTPVSDLRLMWLWMTVVGASLWPTVKIVASEL
jgi:hypothetical protein